MRFSPAVHGDVELGEHGLYVPIRKLFERVTESLKPTKLPEITMVNAVATVSRQEERRREPYGLPAIIYYWQLGCDYQAVGEVQQVFLYVDPKTANAVALVPQPTTGQVQEHHGDVDSVIRKLESAILGSLQPVPV